VSAEDVINNVGKEYGFNDKQWIAFRIIACSSINTFVYGLDLDAEPLRMLMTGPGGTGETHVVKAVQKLMAHNGAAHRIHSCSD
jgi:hypothetical protein